MKIAVHFGGNGAAEMLTRQNATGAAMNLRPVPGGNIGWVQGKAEEHDGNLLLVTGTPLGRPGTPQIRNYRDALRVLPRWDGAFAAVYWDAAHGKLVVVTDCLGFKPLYLRRGPGELRLASETKAIPDAPDLAAWGAFIALGFTIGDRTLVETLERVRPASILIYDVGTDRLEESSYWHWPDPKETDETEGLVDALRRSVAAYAAYGDAGMVLLSGGFDSRLVMFALKEAGLEPRAMIVSHRDEFFDADGRLAAAIARRAGVAHERVVSSEHFFSSRAFLDYIRDSDAATPSLYLFVSQIGQFVGRSAVWEGVVPGYTLTVPHQPPGGFAAYLAQESNGPDSPIWQAARLLFRKEVHEAMQEGFRDDLRRETARYSDDGYGVSEFIVRNRMRNRTSINPYKVYENRVRAFTPGMSKAYWNIAGTLSYDIRKGNRYYLKLLRRHYPAALGAPVLSGNSLVRPSFWSTSYYLNRVLAMIAHECQRHPRLVRRLVPAAHIPFSFAPSRFLDPGILRDPDDPSLDPAAEIPVEGPIGQAAMRLLFHWRVWHWLHQGRLTEKLSPLLTRTAEAGG